VIGSDRGIKTLIYLETLVFWLKSMIGGLLEGDIFLSRADG
jgi:hypothetical protein